MSHTATWPLIVEPESEVTPTTVSPSGPSALPVALDFSPFGFGLIRPFQRDQKGDLATSGGPELVIAAIGQILGTVASSEFSQGELPWRPEFGSLLHLLRHRPNTPALDELARRYVVDALQKWERRVVVTNVDVGRDLRAEKGDKTLIIKVRFNFTDIATGETIFENLESVITI